MEIKCTKCGHPNQLGAIFCRGCGEKLELENLQPDVKASGRAKIGICSSRCEAELLNWAFVVVLFPRDTI